MHQSELFSLFVHTYNIGMYHKFPGLYEYRIVKLSTIRKMSEK